MEPRAIQTLIWSIDNEGWWSAVLFVYVMCPVHPQRGLWKIYHFCHRTEISFSHQLESNDVKVIYRHHEALVNYESDIWSLFDGRERSRKSPNISQNTTTDLSGFISLFTSSIISSFAAYQIVATLSKPVLTTVFCIIQYIIIGFITFASSNGIFSSL